MQKSNLIAWTKYYLIGLIVCFFNFTSLGQQSKKDSLQKLIPNAKHDTIRIRLYLELSEICEVKDNLKYAEPAVQLADSLLSQTTDDNQRKSILKQKAKAYNYISYFYDNKGDGSKYLEYLQKQLTIYQDINDTINILPTISYITSFLQSNGNLALALEYCQKGLSLSKEMNNEKGIAAFLSTMGLLYVDQGEITQALTNLQRANAINHEMKDTSAEARVLLFIGNMYTYDKLKDTTKALECYQNAIVLFEKIKRKRGVSLAYIYIGNMYKGNKDYQNSILNYQKSLSIYEELGDRLSAAETLDQIGMVYSNQGNLAKAIDYHYKALRIAEEFKEEIDIAWSSSSLANAYFKQKKYRMAKYYAERSLEIMKKQIQVENILYVEKQIAQIDSASGNYKEAYYHYQQYIFLRDKLKSEEIRKAAMNERFQNEYDNQKALDKAAQEKKDAIAVEEKRKQKIIFWSVASGLFLVVIFAGFILRSLRITHKQKQVIEIKIKETELQKRIIEEKNKDITDSINYAKRIQQAKLPKREDILTSLPNSFVLYKPKDIVSGDFYYFHKNNKSVIIAAADCTGHGVPGAFMSMIGSERLDDSVILTQDTSELLKYLNKGIKNSLHQSESDESTRDGMDIAICSLDIENYILKFAGANRPLWLIRSGFNVIEEIKATKKALGGLTEEEQHFDTHEIKLQVGDTFYIFSDGFADSFGGQDGKKLTTKKFKEVLLDIQQKSMQEQMKHLDNFIESWIAGTEQVDDILVVGVRI